MIKNQPIQVNKNRNIIKSNNDIINLKINKQNIITKLKINKTKNIPIKEKINSPYKIIQPELNKEPNIYNINIENLNNVQNKLNIFNTEYINEKEKELINSNKNASLQKKGFIKKIKINNKIIIFNKEKINNILKKKFKNYNIKLKKNNLFDLKNKAKSLEKDKINNSPRDNFKKLNRKKYSKLPLKKENVLDNEINLNTFRTERGNANNFTNNFMTIIEGDNEISDLNSANKISPAFNSFKKIYKSKLLSRLNELNEDIETFKKKKIVVMKILRRPSKTKYSDKFINNSIDE